ncbi:cobaltochelatase subunit CobN [Terrarubrum flagellatum]|uniref:cobaltochelatase subunit CobN n=1 Tax=Terrirubrum flagellatum TaxID=2895980 RepID=UPI0031451A7D
MHVLVTPRFLIEDGRQAKQLSFASADIVIGSMADSELALLQRQARFRDEDGPTLTLCNLLGVAKPDEIETFCVQLVAKAKIVALRLLGAETYWREGFERVREEARRAGAVLICIPGDTHWDERFASFGTLDLARTRELWRYFAEGGPENIANAMTFLDHLIGRGEAPPQAVAMPPAGVLARAAQLDPAKPLALILFYRALAQSGATDAIEALAHALGERGLSVLPIYLTSLKDESAIAILARELAARGPDVILNATAFASGTPGVDSAGGPLARYDCSVLQVALAGSTEEEWRASPRGLAPRDLAMNVVLPEVDGRVAAGVIAFKTPPGKSAGPASSIPHAEGIAHAADLTAAWTRLRRARADERRIAIILANYPNRDGRMANGVGLDTPASAIEVMRMMRDAGYRIDRIPENGDALMREIAAGPTNDIARRGDRIGGARLSLQDYAQAFAQLPDDARAQILSRWGAPESDPHVSDGAFELAIRNFGHVVIGVQPARGYNIDPKSTYHDPDLVPPHHYLAFHIWLRDHFDAHAVVHLGKHGNLEWLPGKATALSPSCWPRIALGALPNLYPFIVNDPGEGVQAKRRAGAVVIDHLTPPLTRAELHGDLAELESLIDEYALAADLDPRRADSLADDILASARALRLDADLGLSRDAPRDEALRLIDATLCDVKEMQIRDGLHVFGQTPASDHLNELIVAIARSPRLVEGAENESLHRALAADLGLTGFDPLTRDLAAPWSGARPHALESVATEAWRTQGDTVERLEKLASALVAGDIACDPSWTHARAVLDWIERDLRPSLTSSAGAELDALKAGLAARFVAPGPSGAPTRGRPDVLPTGRNFYAIDVRAAPTPAAWRIGCATADAIVERHWRETGAWPRTVALSVWGTANMRTGGDDIAQALALIGARPVWESSSGRVTGFEIMTGAERKRPRVDVTLRVSGLFRDAFPTQIDLFDSAVRAIAALDEPDDENPIAAATRAEAAQGENSRRAMSRVFGSKPGAYGAGLQALIDEKGWRERGDFAEAYKAWGGYAYGGGQEGDAVLDLFERRLAKVEIVAQAQDNREHDILDSDDYYQFMGGLSAAVEKASGHAPRIFHLDTSRPETPLARSLDEEIARVVRGRAANPKWIAGVMRHGYKGAFEMAATVDYLFAFSATTNAVKSHHFDQLFESYLQDDKVRAFMRDANPAALREMAERFQEAIERSLWTPRSNRARALLDELAESGKDAP